MARLTRRDRVLLFSLLPIFALSFALHVKEVLRTGFAQPPVFASPGQGDDAYPRVGGLRLERGIEWNDLVVGDTLIRVGEVDLRGVGYAGFDAIALEQAGLERTAPLVFEREGERREIELRLAAHARPWVRVPFLLSFVLASLLILLRAPGSKHAQALFAAFVSFAIVECHFFGGSRLQSYVSIYIFNFGGAAAVFLLLRWLILFPEEVASRDRLSLRWAWLGVAWILVRLNYFLGGPIPPQDVPGAVLTVDASFGILGLAIATWNYVHANRIGRRRFKWIVLGAYVGTTPWLASGLASYVGLPELAFHRMFEIFMLVQVAIPLGVLIAVVRFNVFDIDRVLSSAVSYTVSVAALVGLTFSAVPAAAGALAEAIGWSEASLHVPLAGLLVGLGLLVGRRLRPQLDRILFPERLALQEAVPRLLRDLGNCRRSSEVVSLVERRVATAARPVHLTLLERGVWRFAERGRAVLGLEIDGALVRGLEANPLPLEVNEETHPFLSSIGAQLLLPLRSGNDLAAILVLGPKQSGDVYTPNEISLLGSVCERASGELLRLRDAEVLQAERTRGDELEDLKEHAEHANLSRARFLAAASHDLRQPLHALGLFAETLSERIGEDDAPELVERIRGSTESLSEMLDALLDMSRLDAGSIEPSVSEFEIGPMTERLVAELADAAHTKGLTLLAEPTKQRVRSDPVLLGRIVQNFVANAVRYTEEGGVWLRCIVVGDGLRIEVEDTGPGIPPHDHDEIFGEFVRMGEGREDGGLGLGLSIASRMARLLGHELSLESTPGRGSTFAVVVPLAGESSASIAALPVDFGGRLVAVVDDDLEVLDGTGRLLRQWGCEVLLAGSLDAAIESCEGAARRPDAMLVDHRIGDGTTGLEVVERLNALFDQPIPAAIVTGETTSQVLGEIRASGLRHLAKPVAPFKLRALLMELLRERGA